MTDQPNKPSASQENREHQGTAKKPMSLSTILVIGVLLVVIALLNNPSIILDWFSASGDTGYAASIIKKNLRSPSSFREHSSEVVWSGVDNQNRPARIVRIEYDAQNGFGATLRDCRYVAFSFTDDDSVEWNTTHGIEGCGLETLQAGRQAAINSMRHTNWDVEY